MNGELVTLFARVLVMANQLSVSGQHPLFKKRRPLESLKSLDIGTLNPRNCVYLLHWYMCCVMVS
jgi:hypothetical protein